MSWPLVSLNEICDLVNGYAFKSSDYVSQSNTLSCRMSNIRPDGNFDINYNARYLPDEFSKKYKNFLLKDNDVVIAMTDLADSPKILGVPTVVYTSGKNILLNQRVGKLVIKDEKKVFFPYLKFALNDPKVRAIYKKFAGGGLQINLGKNDLLSVQIPLPPLNEQKRIAAILDKADAVRRKRQQALELSEQLLRSVFLDMFGDPNTNPKGWDEGTLGDIIHFAKDGPHVSPKYSDDGIPFLSTRHIKQFGVIWDDLKYISLEEAERQWKKCKPQFNDVLYTKGGTTGIAAYVNFHEDFAIWVHVALLRPKVNIVNPIWLTAMLNTKYCYSQSQSLTHGATNKDLGLKRMIKIKMYIPPLEKQEKYAEFYKFLNRHLEKSKDKLTTLDNLFHSLVQKAFRGELSKHLEKDFA